MTIRTTSAGRPKSAPWFGLISILICLVSGFLPVQAAQEVLPPGLFMDVPVPGVAIARRPTVARGRTVTLNVAGLKESCRPGAKLGFNLFPAQDYEAEVRQVVQRGENDYTLVGELSNRPFSTFALSVKDGVAVMNVRSDQEVFHLRYIGNGLYDVRQIDERKYPPCGNAQKHAVAPVLDPVVTPTNPTPSADATAADVGSTIDVLVVYTPASRIAAGGTAAMEALVNLAVDEANAAYAASLITARLRLVHQQEVNYTESGSFDTDLGRLTSTNDGFIDEVHALRNTYGADMVSMLINDSAYCGLAWVMTALSTSFASSAFSTVYWDCATGYYSFAHELGHNMGCQHDRANAGTGLYPYSYGWHFTGTNGGDYRTIMAYAPGTRIQRFSNPDVTYYGTPTGVPAGAVDAANNASTINNSAATLAAFRASVGGCTNTILSPASTNVSSGAMSGTIAVSALGSCSWTAVSGDSFITITAGGAGTGNGNVSYTVAANATTSSRAGAISIGGQTFSTTQAGAPTLADALDTPGNIVWTTGGNKAWAAQTAVAYDGVDAGRSGAITRNQQSYLETTLSGPLTLAFRWKVSSQSGGDFLKVTVDGSVSNQISGEVDWQQVSLAIPSGSHTIRFTYVKDNNVNAGSDASWLDQVTIGGSTAPHHLILTSGDNQSATVGTVLPLSPTVQVQDASGNPVAGVSVNFSVQSGGGSVQNATVFSDANGFAATRFTLGTTAGLHTFRASAALTGTPNAVTISATGVPDAAHHLALLTQPSTAVTAGVSWLQQPVLRVEDQFGNLRSTDNTTTVTATRALGVGALQGTIILQASAGLVTFTNLAHQVANSITVNFLAAGLGSVNSSAVNVSPGPFEKLQLLVPGETAAPGSDGGKTGTPADQSVGGPFSLTVNAVDAYWNLVPSITDAITLMSSDVAAVFPSSTNLAAGKIQLTATFGTAGSHTLTAADVPALGRAPSTSPAINVGKGNQLITFATLINRTYGAAPFALTAGASSGLPVSLSVVSGPAALAGNLLTLNGIGLVNIRATQQGDINWNGAPPIERSFTVQAALLSVIPGSASRLYGQGNPALAGVVSGVVAGDNITASYSTLATAASPVGAYPITPSLSDPLARLSNYTVQSTNGILSVTPAATAGLLTSSANPALPGSPITFTCNLAILPAGAGVVDGAVQFTLNGTNAGSPVPVVNATASFTTPLPAGSHAVAALYLGSANLTASAAALPASQIVNTPPIAAPDTIERWPTNGTKVALTALLANDSDADGDALTFVALSATSAQGAAVSLNGAWIVYTPPPGFTNADSFTYSISDGHGATVSGTVQVNLRSDSGLSANLTVTDLGNGSYRIHLDGVPNRLYRIQYTSDLINPLWTDLTSAATDTNGILEFVDTPPGSTRFYRSAYP